MGDTDNSMVDNHWKTSYYEVLGLLDIETVDGRTVAQDVEAVVAEHMVKLHNDWLEIQVWATYMPNIAWARLKKPLSLLDKISKID